MKKIVFLLFLSIPCTFSGFFYSPNEVAKGVSSLITISLGTVTIKGATEQVNYHFNKYPGKLLKYGPNKLNALLSPTSVPMSQNTLLSAGMFDAGKTTLNSDGLADDKGLTTLAPVQQNLATVLFIVDPAQKDNTNRTFVLVAKNSITSPDSDPISIANSLVIDLTGLCKTIVSTIASSVPSFGSKLMLGPISDMAFVLNVSFDAVTADISLDSIDVAYKIVPLMPLSVDKKLDQYMHWYSKTFNRPSFGSFGAPDPLTYLSGIDFSSTKK